MGVSPMSGKSAGSLSLRHPVIKVIRSDKRPGEADSVEGDQGGVVERER